MGMGSGGESVEMRKDSRHGFDRDGEEVEAGAEGRWMGASPFFPAGKVLQRDDEVGRMNAEMGRDAPPVIRAVMAVEVVIGGHGCRGPGCSLAAKRFK